MDKLNNNSNNKSIIPFNIAKSKGLNQDYSNFENIIDKNTGSIILSDKAIINSLFKIDKENFDTLFNYNNLNNNNGNKSNYKDSGNNNIEDGCFYMHLIIPSYILEINNIINSSYNNSDNGSFWEIGCKIFEFNKIGMS